MSHFERVSNVTFFTEGSNIMIRHARVVLFLTLLIHVSAAIFLVINKAFIFNMLNPFSIFCTYMYLVNMNSCYVHSCINWNLNTAIYKQYYNFRSAIFSFPEI